MAPILTPLWAEGKNEDLVLQKNYVVRFSYLIK